MKRERGKHRRLASGALAGLVATGAMSVVFVAADRAEVIGRTPPRLIIDRFLPFLPSRAADWVAVLAHFGYGISGGAGYKMLQLSGARTAARGAARGVGFGLLIWAASYEGWLPLTQVLPPAHKDHSGRALTVIAAHLVYGATLGLLTTSKNR